MCHLTEGRITLPECRQVSTRHWWWRDRELQAQCVRCVGLDPMKKFKWRIKSPAKWCFSGAYPGFGLKGFCSDSSLEEKTFQSFFVHPHLRNFSDFFGGGGFKATQVLLSPLTLFQENQPKATLECFDLLPGVLPPQIGPGYCTLSPWFHHSAPQFLFEEENGESQAE